MGPDRVLWYPEWGQGAPYNNDCPPCDYWSNTPTGCVATALAIFISTYNNKVIAGVDLSALNRETRIATDSPNAANIAKVMRQLGTDLNMEYNCGGSSASLVEDGPRVLSKYNIQHELISGNLNYSKMATLLIRDMGRCVLARGANSAGEGHAWVYTGIRGQGTTTGSFETLQVNITSLEGVYCNWGWDGTSNGWFLYHTRPNNNNDFNVQPWHIYPK